MMMTTSSRLLKLELPDPLAKTLFKVLWKKPGSPEYHKCHPTAIQLPSTATHQGSHTCFQGSKGHGSSSMAPIHLLLAVSISTAPPWKEPSPPWGPSSHLLGCIEHAFDASKGYQDYPKKNQINDLDPRIQEQSCSVTRKDLRPEDRRTHIW